MSKFVNLSRYFSLALEILSTEPPQPLNYLFPVLSPSTPMPPYFLPTSLLPKRVTWEMTERILKWDEQAVSLKLRLEHSRTPSRDDSWGKSSVWISAASLFGPVWLSSALTRSLKALARLLGLPHSPPVFLLLGLPAPVVKREGGELLIPSMDGGSYLSWDYSPQFSEIKHISLHSFLYRDSQLGSPAGILVT